MRLRKEWWGILLLVILFWPTKQANALPSWGRKYNADCSMCHTMIPQLNHVGHKFRRLGYRMPDEFDKGSAEMSADDLTKFANYFAARGRARVTDALKSGTKSAFNFELHDVTLFYAGPVSRNLGFFFELPFEPETGSSEPGKGELEVAQINLTFGNDAEHVFFSRVGQFHQFSRVGFGGLDRPIGLSNARMFEVRVNGFRPRHDGLGVEAGYSAHNVTGLVQVTNGIKAAGGSVLDNSDENNDKDLALLLEYVAPDTDASVTALYVYGRAPAPVNDKGATLAGSKPTRYNRAYLFADTTIESLGLRPLVGGGIGFDNQFVSGLGKSSAALVSASSSRSWFGFLELDQKLKDQLYALARFDYDDVTNQAEASAATQKTWQGSGGVVYSFQKYLRLAAEYNVTHTQGVANAHKVTGEMQFNF